MEILYHFIATNERLIISNKSAETNHLPALNLGTSWCYLGEWY